MCQFLLFQGFREEKSEKRKTRKSINKFGQGFSPSLFIGVYIFFLFSFPSLKLNAPLRLILVGRK
jgi:hypothetical protein